AKIAGNATTMAIRARVPTRKRRRTIVPVWATAKCFSAISVRHTNTATPTVTPATSLHHGESDIAEHEQCEQSNSSSTRNVRFPILDPGSKLLPGETDRPKRFGPG